LTGDLGYFDEDGYLFIKGRIKDIINRGGEKVAPAQVENVLSQLQFVKEVSVIGTPDEMYGEAVTAVVISQSGADKDMQEQMIKDYATETLANYEQPTKVVFVDDYPRNATGKVLRLKLKKQILDNSIGEVV
jgi:Acyl-CoA synthetases (AMP-forming)/AMP-acid ligases II